jgi:hypothetical protein
MGSPAALNKQQVALLVRAARLSARQISLGPVSQAGSVSLKRRLPLQGVQLIEVAGESS